jgi:hypothetical protein
MVDRHPKRSVDDEMRTWDLWQPGEEETNPDENHEETDESNFDEYQYDEEEEARLDAEWKALIEIQHQDAAETNEPWNRRLTNELRRIEEEATTAQRSETEWMTEFNRADPEQLSTDKKYDYDTPSLTARPALKSKMTSWPNPAELSAGYPEAKRSRVTTSPAPQRRGLGPPQLLTPTVPPRRKELPPWRRGVSAGGAAEPLQDAAASQPQQRRMPDYRAYSPSDVSTAISPDSPMFLQCKILRNIIRARGGHISDYYWIGDKICLPTWLLVRTNA